MEPTTTVEARVTSVYADTQNCGDDVRDCICPPHGTRIGYRAQIVIWRDLNEVEHYHAPHTRTDITEAWRDARVMRTYELVKRQLPIS